MPQAILSDARCWVAHMGLNQVRGIFVAASDEKIRMKGFHSLHKTERALVLLSPDLGAVNRQAQPGGQLTMHKVCRLHQPLTFSSRAGVRTLWAWRSSERVRV